MAEGAKIPTALQCELYSLGCFDTNVQTTPLWSTIASDNTAMFNALVEGGANLEDGIRATTYYAHYRGLKLMIEEGANVNCVDEHGNTVLMRAAFEFDKEKKTVETRLSCVNLVLQAGARVNKTNRQDRNALDRCLCNQPMRFTEDIARLLFAAGEKIRDAKPKSDILKKLKAKEDDIMSLKAICRKSIRRHLLDLDPHLNLFQRIPKFEATHVVKEYMLFRCTLDE